MQLLNTVASTEITYSSELLFLFSGYPGQSSIKDDPVVVSEQLIFYEKYSAVIYGCLLKIYDDNCVAETVMCHIFCKIFREKELFSTMLKAKLIDLLKFTWAEASLFSNMETSVKDVNQCNPDTIAGRLRSLGR